MGQIRDVFDVECAHVQINHHFFKELVALEARFVNKKPEHIEFFGGTQTGVQVVRFTSEDRDRLFTDVLEIDDRDLEQKLYALKDKNGHFVINQEWKTSSDIFNLTVVWIMHAVDNATKLNPKEKEEAKIRICQYMIYKFLTSLLFHYFRFPADPEVAAATYAQLSLKFSLKQYGSWGGVCRHLAEHAVAVTGFRNDVIKTMEVDKDVGDFLASTQGAIRGILKNYYAEFSRVGKAGGRISRSSSMMEIDGEVILKDKTKSLANYTRYINTVVPDANSFIKTELVDIIAKVMHTMPERLLRQSLMWASQNYGHTRDRLVERSIELIADHAFAYLSENRSLLHNTGDLASLVSKLRGAYMSSRSTDPQLLEIREMVNSIVSQATKSKNDSVIASTRTGFMIYVIVRMFSMRHYASA